MTGKELDWLRATFDRRESKHLGHTFAGLEYDTELASSEGVSVLLFTTEDTPDEQIERAKAAARNQRDVVRFHVRQVPKAWLEEEKFTPEKQGGWLDAARWIVENKQARRIDSDSQQLVPEKKRGGKLVDLFSASALIKVHDALNEKNQIKFRAMHISAALHVAFQLIK